MSAFHCHLSKRDSTNLTKFAHIFSCLFFILTHHSKPFPLQWPLLSRVILAQLQLVSTQKLIFVPCQTCLIFQRSSLQEPNNRSPIYIGYSSNSLHSSNAKSYTKLDLLAQIFFFKSLPLALLVWNPLFFLQKHQTILNRERRWVMDLMCAWT